MFYNSGLTRKTYIDQIVLRVSKGNTDLYDYLTNPNIFNQLQFNIWKVNVNNTSQIEFNDTDKIDSTDTTYYYPDDILVDRYNLPAGFVSPINVSNPDSRQFFGCYEAKNLADRKSRRVFFEDLQPLKPNVMAVLQGTRTPLKVRYRKLYETLNLTTTPVHPYLLVNDNDTNESLSSLHTALWLNYGFFMAYSFIEDFLNAGTMEKAFNKEKVTIERFTQSLPLTNKTDIPFLKL